MCVRVYVYVHVGGRCVCMCMHEGGRGKTLRMCAQHVCDCPCTYWCTGVCVGGAEGIHVMAPVHI